MHHNAIVFRLQNIHSMNIQAKGSPFKAIEELMDNRALTLNIVRRRSEGSKATVSRCLHGESAVANRRPGH